MFFSVPGSSNMSDTSPDVEAGAENTAIRNLESNSIAKNFVKTMKRSCQNPTALRPQETLRKLSDITTNGICQSIGGIVHHGNINGVGPVMD